MPSINASISSTTSFLLILLSTILIGTASNATPYSEKSAFCRDYANNRSSIYSSTFQYDLTRIYNQCMRNAERLIEEYYQRKEELERRSRKNAEERMKKRMAEEKKAREEQEKINNIIDNIEDSYF